MTRQEIEKILNNKSVGYMYNLENPSADVFYLRGVRDALDLTWPMAEELRMIPNRISKRWFSPEIESVLSRVLTRRITPISSLVSAA